MTEADNDTFPIEGTTGEADPHANESFALFGNETRLAILVALWAAYEPQTTRVC